MKNSLLTLGFLFVLVMNAVAQNGPSNPAVEKTSNSVTRLMVQSIGLNESEYITVKALNQERLVKAAEVAKMYGSDAEMRDARLKEIESNFESELFKVLNSRQVEAYSDFKNKPEGNFLSMVQEVAKAGKN
ncbi:hypothetical protein [Rufibacter latericius]|uniref:DUF4168 domain-containing protein n=1 Tax=Rufibacter latericius TaxID=2487040 RepID=A0A3M9ML39_9BACT|nr:hypothetical protein [Rufibacter latericius]RNI26254.1 hypothetical protein EFB08_15735 [Rufibacter latericius]